MSGEPAFDYDRIRAEATRRFTAFRRSPGLHPEWLTPEYGLGFWLAKVAWEWGNKKCK